MFSGFANLIFGSTAANTNPEGTDPQLEDSLTGVATNPSANNDRQNSSCDSQFLFSETENDDWIFIDREDDEESLPRTDSEGELPFVEIKRLAAVRPRTAPNSRSRRRRHRQQATRLANQSSPSAILSLSPQRDVVTRSLYVVSPLPDRSTNLFSANTTACMEESWFLTPPPCFTSTSPINMELSPFENLLIEHPSMSVYHSIRSAQETTESFVNLDVAEEETFVVERKAVRKAARKAIRSATSTALQLRAGNPIDIVKSGQLKEELLFHNAQKAHEKKARETIGRGAIKRNNKVREFNSNGNRQRRAEMQHCRTVSGANNNRKC